MNRDELTSAVTRIPKGAKEALRNSEPEPDAAVLRSREGSSGIYFVSKVTGNIIASLLVCTLVGLAYVVSTYFTWEHQVEYYKTQQKQMRQEIDALEEKNLVLERRMVELSTQVENMKDGT